MSKSNDSIQIRIENKELEQLLAQKKAQARGKRPMRRPPQQQQGLGINMPAISISIVTAVVIFAAFYVYIAFFGDARIIKGFEASVMPSLTIAEEQPAADYVRITEAWNSGDVQTATVGINTFINQYPTVDPEVTKVVKLYRLESLVLNEKYQLAANNSSLLKREFSSDTLFQAHVDWYRGHIFYFQGEFGDAFTAFTAVAESKHELKGKAEDIAYQLEGIVAKDGLTELFE